MPSGHIAHASLRGDAWIHYYLVMDFTDNNNQTILIDRSIVWVHGTYQLLDERFHLVNGGNPANAKSGKEK